MLVTGAVACFAALFLGQAALRLAGAREWSWLSPPVGMATAMLVAAPAADVPGRATTIAVLLALSTIAAAAWCLRTPEHRPPLGGLLAAVPVALLALVPFAAAGRGGILGVSVDNDMAAHLLFVEGIISSAVASVTPLPREYPLGPHAVVAALSRGLGIGPDLAFSGWTLALPIINAWIVQAVARRASWFGKAVVATVVGMPFLIAAYYGEGSFKEISQAGFVLAIAISLAGYNPTQGRWRWVPFALLVGGIVSVYSLAGLPWPLTIVAAWLLGLLAIGARRGRLCEVPTLIRAEIPRLGIGLAVFVVAVLPQAQRMWDFIALRHGTGISVNELGNLVGPLPVWEAFGVWNGVDFRFPASPAFTGGMWTAFVLGLVLFGTYWAFRRGRWMLPLAALAAMGIWWVSEHSQSPYVTAKALVIASPLLLLLAVLPLIDRGPGRRPLWPWLLVPALSLVLFLRICRDDIRTLRWSSVGPTNHAEQLRTLRPLIHSKPTLFLVTDDFVEWELAGVPVTPAVIEGGEKLPIRPQKAWSLGRPLDFDSVDAATLNRYDWVVTTRDPAGSAPPQQLRLARLTPNYELWHRVGRVRERQILNEEEMPGAVLDCDGGEGHAILRAGGVAAVRQPPVVAPAPSIGAGETASVKLSLFPGVWELETPYTSPLPVDVTSRGLSTTLPASLDRPGSRWRIGRVIVREAGPVTVTFHTEKINLTPAGAGVVLGSVVATLRAPEQVVPVRLACGHYVDWYRSARH